MMMGEPKGVGPAAVDALLELHDLSWSGQAALPAIRTVLQPAVRGQSLSASGLAVVPVGAFNRWLAALTQEPPLDVQPGKATVVVMYLWKADLPGAALHLVFRDFEPWHSGFACAGPAGELPLGETRVLPALNLTTQTSLVAVVDEATFAQLAGPAHPLLSGVGQHALL
jgi:hypothetical protein